jgi:hypothetical protein
MALNLSVRKCECGCGRNFIPKREGQRFYNASSGLGGTKSTSNVPTLATGWMSRWASRGARGAIF